MIIIFFALTDISDSEDTERPCGLPGLGGSEHRYITEPFPLRCHGGKKALNGEIHENMHGTKWRKYMKTCMALNREIHENIYALYMKHACFHVFSP